MELEVRERVAVACVTFETVMISDPIVSMGSVDRVYLLHYERPDPSRERHVYKEFYDEVVRQLQVGMQCGEIVPVNVVVYDFQEVLGVLLDIMTREQGEGNDVYVNVSAGSTEYSAAAILASMMVRGVRPFTVGTREFTIPAEKIDIYYDGDRPVGLSKEVYPARQLPFFHISRPDDDLVTGLRVLRERLDKGHSTTYVRMIEALKDAGCWQREGKERVKDQVQAEKMYYARHFIDAWVSKGWVSKTGRRRLELTAAGETVTNVF